jgi:hypothetical protein
LSSRRAKRALVAVALFGCGAVAAACELILPIHDNIPDLLDASEASSADTTITPIQATNVCAVGVHPLPPPSTDDDTAGSRTYVFTISAIDILEPNGFGFDVDGVCSCDPRDHTIHDGGFACVAPNATGMVGQCDYDGGVDNALGTEINRIGFPVAPTVSDRVNSQILCGNGSVVMVLTGYNGLANDRDVYIQLMVSYGIHEPHDGGDPSYPEGGFINLVVDGGNPEAGVKCGDWNGQAYPPQFNGSDLWSAPPDATTPNSFGPLPKTPYLHGYVNDWVFTTDTSALPPGAKVDVPITGSNVMPVITPILSARLVPLDVNLARVKEDAGAPAAYVRIDRGTVAGRITSDDLLLAFGTIPLVVGGPLPACQTPYWPQIQTGACNGTDLTDDPDGDFKDKPCNALSLALGFSAFPSLIGEVVDVEGGVSPDACPPSTLHCQ